MVTFLTVFVVRPSYIVAIHHIRFDMKPASFLLLLFVTRFAVAVPDDYPKNKNIDALNYTFAIQLSDETDVIDAAADLDLRFRTAGITSVRLDLIQATDSLDGRGMNVKLVTFDGVPTEYTHEGEVLMVALPKVSEAGARHIIRVEYSGIPATGFIIGDNKHGDRTFFSDNWPNRARHWLPLIDHPYDKATCEFIVTAPDHYQVVSNGLLVEKTDLGDGTRLTHWRQSVPIATWLYALGVARFAVQYVDDFQGKDIQTWVYYQDRDAGFYDFAVPTKAAMEFYSDMVGPFSYEKLANIQSNSVGGGMEAATAIFYGDRSVTGERSERWRNVIIHEVAHQWFGNSVTEYDWNDVWLSEGFATYFTLLFIEHAYGRDAFVRGLKSSKERIKNFNKDNPDYKIVHDNLTDMTKVTTGQTYQKGAWTLHMLRGLVGDDAWWKGIQTYYAEYQDRNASTADFMRHMEEASGRELDGFFNQWLRRGGMMELEGDWTYDSRAKEVTVTLSQQTAATFAMPIQVGIYANESDAPVVSTIDLNRKTQTFSIPSDDAPVRVVIDPDTWALANVSFTRR